jgi:predicted transcriptional regulator
MSNKKITLKPEFPPAKITVDEEIYTILKDNGPLPHSRITDKLTRRSGGNVTAAIKNLMLRGFINKRKCECGMHDVYEVVK